MTCRTLCRFSSFIAVALLTMAQVTPVIFERADIRIDPVAPTETPRMPINYDVEVRSEDALKLEYIHTLNTLTDKTGVVIAFTAPVMVAIPHWQVFTPVDVLFVAEDGTVLQIYPDAVLAELQQDVYAKEPVKAFVFLKAGEVAAKHILPKDIIAGSMFVAAPPVMQ